MIKILRKINVIYKILICHNQAIKETKYKIILCIIEIDAEMLPIKYNENNRKLFQLYKLKVRMGIIKTISSFSETGKGQPYPA